MLNEMYKQNIYYSELSISFINEFNSRIYLPTAGMTCPSLRLSQAQCGNTTSPYPGSVRANAKYSDAFFASCKAFNS